MKRLGCGRPREMFGIAEAYSTAELPTKDDPTDQQHWGHVGNQTIEDTGALTKKRMETIDDIRDAQKRARRTPK